MTKKYYDMSTYNIIAIGGTGMRCAECIVHLCAMGMFDDTEIKLLALDTDYKNGNFKRLKSLVDNYNRITADRRGVASDTLFSAKIEYYTFSPDYSAGTNYDIVSHYSDAQSSTHDEDGVKWAESDIADLFLTPEMRKMDLQHGYRAQTQMGSMLMYHAIKEEAYKNKGKNSDLVKYVENLMTTPGSIVFMLGSVFGGTGASSIPILPHALQEAAKIVSKDGQGDLLSKNLFGTVMLTNYFSFNVPNTSDSVFATSDKFALNSQAALSFYNEDETVRSTYKRLYIIGREKTRNVSEDVESVTGGDAQRNPEDYLELVAASAAYDFYQTAKAQTHSVRSEFDEEAKFFYRTMAPNADGYLAFESFFGSDREKFAQKCGIMMASAFLFGPQDFANNRRKHESFKALTEENVKDIRDYFRMFYDLEHLDEKVPGSGWVKQMNDSATAQEYEGFLFNKKVFNTSPTTAGTFKYNEELYLEDSRKYKTGLLSGKDGAYDKFKKEFGDTVFGDSDRSAVSALLKRTYDTFTTLYGFQLK